MGVEIQIRNTETYKMDDVNISDRELVYHVRDALTSVLSGDSIKYGQLVAVLHPKDNHNFDEALLETSLKALSGSVSYIDPVHHDSLLNAIYGMSMWNYEPALMDALVDLIISLAASNGKHVDLCLHMLICNFRPPSYFLDKLTQPHFLKKKQHVLSRVHGALKNIADLVPLSPLRLVSLVVQRMPTLHSRDHKVMFIYLENMLKLESGALGELVGSTILMAVVDRLIDLDVEIGWDDILQEDFSRGIFDMELEDMDEAADDAELDGGEVLEGPLSRKRLGGNVIAELLDSLMVLTFEHLESCEAAGRLIEVFETLLKSFEMTVLNAYKSKFAQFVMFYACALDPENCGVRFATLLADHFVRDGLPQPTRMSAVAYLASYLSRAKFLSTSFIFSMLRRLVDWGLEYCKFQDGDIDVKAHRVFYSGCQLVVTSFSGLLQTACLIVGVGSFVTFLNADAIMYVLCFRMRSIMDVPRLKTQLLLMPLEQILKHKLNPLQVCLPSVVLEFFRQAKAARLFTVSKAFMFNDLLELKHSSSFGGLERLDMFFPFDPCLLKKCDSFIRPHFVFWSMVRTTYDGDTEGSSEEDDAEDFVNGNVEEDIMDDMMAGSLDEQDLNLDEFDYALNKMSITPKNSFCYRFRGHLQEPMRMPSRIRPSTSPESL